MNIFFGEERGRVFGGSTPHPLYLAPIYDLEKNFPLKSYFGLFGIYAIFRPNCDDGRRRKKMESAFDENERRICENNEQFKSFLSETNRQIGPGEFGLRNFRRNGRKNAKSCFGNLQTELKSI